MFFLFCFFFQRVDSNQDLWWRYVEVNKWDSFQAGRSQDGSVPPPLDQPEAALLDFLGVALR